MANIEPIFQKLRPQIPAIRALFDLTVVLINERAPVGSCYFSSLYWFILPAPPVQPVPTQPHANCECGGVASMPRLHPTGCHIHARLTLHHQDTILHRTPPHRTAPPASRIFGFGATSPAAPYWRGCRCSRPNLLTHAEGLRRSCRGLTRKRWRRWRWGTMSWRRRPGHVALSSHPR